MLDRALDRMIYFLICVAYFMVLGVVFGATMFALITAPFAGIVIIEFLDYAGGQQDPRH